MQWQDGQDRKFRNLSQTAKAAATLHFIRGYYTMDRSKRMKTRFPLTLPPFSIYPDRVNLLDARVMQEFFNEYNSVALDKGRRTVQDVADNFQYGEMIAKMIRRGCKT